MRTLYSQGLPKVDRDARQLLLVRPKLPRPSDEIRMIEPDTREHHLREGAKYVQHDMIRAGADHLIQQDIMQTLRQVGREWEALRHAKFNVPLPIGKARDVEWL